jgi:proline iminopeptidase
MPREGTVSKVSIFLTCVLAVAAATPLRAQPQTSGTIDVPGAHLPYVVVGRGLPCITYGSELYYPRVFSQVFADALQCAHVAERGFVPGATRRDGVPFGVSEAVADIELARQQLRLERFVMVGHSIHGLVALAYAAKYPEHVTHVVAIGGLPSLPTNGDSVRAYRARQFSAGRRAQHDKNRLALDSLTRAHPGRRVVASYVANGALYWADSTFDSTPLWSGVAINDALVTDLQTTPFQWDLSGDPIKVPAFVALGVHDYVVPPTVWKGVRTPFASLTIRVFDRAGHTPQYENATDFDREVLRFFRSRQ